MSKKKKFLTSEQIADLYSEAFITGALRRQGETFSALIPDCTFISFESGGHLMAGNEKVIEEELARFVERTK